MATKQTGKTSPTKMPAAQKSSKGIILLIIIAGVIVFFAASFALVYILVPPTTTTTHTTSIQYSGNANVTLTISDTPKANVSQFYVGIEDVSLHNKNTGVWYNVSIKGNHTIYDLSNLKNIFANIGTVTVPAGQYDQIRLTIIPLGVLNNTPCEPATPTNVIVLHGLFNFTGTSGNHTDWVNLDYNISRSLHFVKTRGPGEAGLEGCVGIWGGGGDIGDLPNIDLLYRDNATLDVNGTSDIAGPIIWGVTPVYYDYGMNTNGAMLEDYFVPPDENLTITNQTTFEPGNDYPPEYQIGVYNQTHTSCSNGYSLGSDGQCHAVCGTSGYCGAGSTCYDDECIMEGSCPAGTVDTGDGYCTYVNSTTQGDCPDGFYQGPNGACFQNGDSGAAECGPDEYDAGDGYCYSVTTVESTSTESTTVESTTTLMPGACGENQVLAAPGVCCYNDETYQNGKCCYGSSCYSPECAGGYEFNPETGQCGSTTTTVTTTEESTTTAQTTTTVSSQICPDGYTEALNQEDCCPDGYPEYSDGLHECCTDTSFTDCVGGATSTSVYTTTTVLQTSCGDNQYEAAPGVCCYNYEVYNETSGECENEVTTTCTTDEYEAAPGVCCYDDEIYNGSSNSCELPETTTTVSCGDGQYEAVPGVCCYNDEVYNETSGECEYPQSTTSSTTTVPECPAGSSYWAYGTGGVCCPDGSYYSGYGTLCCDNGYNYNNGGCCLPGYFYPGEGNICCPDGSTYENGECLNSGS